MTPYTNVSYGGGKALQREAHIPFSLWHVAKTGLPLFSANQALLYLLGCNTGHIPAGCLTYIPVLLDESHFGWFVLSTPRIVIFQISHGNVGWKHSNDFNLNTFKTNQAAPWSGHFAVLTVWGFILPVMSASRSVSAIVIVQSAFLSERHKMKEDSNWEMKQLQELQLHGTSLQTTGQQTEVCTSKSH